MFNQSISSSLDSLHSALENEDWNRFYNLLNTGFDFSSEFNNSEKNPLAFAIYQLAESNIIGRGDYLHRIKMLICYGASVERQEVKRAIDQVTSSDINFLMPLEDAKKLNGQNKHIETIKNVCKEIREIPGKYVKKANSRRQDTLNRLSELEKEFSQYSNVYLDRVVSKNNLVATTPEAELLRFKSKLKNIYCLIQEDHIANQGKFSAILRDKFQPLWSESKLARLVEEIIKKYFPDINIKALLISIIDETRIATPSSSASSSLVFLPQQNQSNLERSAEIQKNQP